MRIGAVAARLVDFQEVGGSIPLIRNKHEPDTIKHRNSL
jgi:hypothetical protein